MLPMLSPSNLRGRTEWFHLPLTWHKLLQLQLAYGIWNCESVKLAKLNKTTPKLPIYSGEKLWGILN